jgi:hypothetical protein
VAARQAAWAEAVLRRARGSHEEEVDAVWRTRAERAVDRVVVARWTQGLDVPAWLVPVEGSRMEDDDANDDERTKFELWIAGALLVRLFSFGVLVRPAEGSVPVVVPQPLVVGARRTQAAETPRFLPQALVVGAEARQEFEAASTRQRAEARVRAYAVTPVVAGVDAARRGELAETTARLRVEGRAEREVEAHGGEGVGR